MMHPLRSGEIILPFKRIIYHSRKVSTKSTAGFGKISKKSHFGGLAWGNLWQFVGQSVKNALKSASKLYIDQNNTRLIFL